MVGQLSEQPLGLPVSLLTIPQQGSTVWLRALLCMTAYSTWQVRGPTFQVPWLSTWP